MVEEGVRHKHCRQPAPPRGGTFPAGPAIDQRCCMTRDCYLRNGVSPRRPRRPASRRKNPATVLRRRKKQRSNRRKLKRKRWQSNSKAIGSTGCGKTHCTKGTASAVPFVHRVFRSMLSRAVPDPSLPFGKRLPAAKMTMVWAPGVYG